jgi:hypothetical protein
MSLGPSTQAAAEGEQIAAPNRTSSWIAPSERAIDRTAALTLFSRPQRETPNMETAKKSRPLSRSAVVEAFVAVGRKEALGRTRVKRARKPGPRHKTTGMVQAARLERAPPV